LRASAVPTRLSILVFSLHTAALSSCSPQPGTCRPKTCQSIGAGCGQASDGCGGALECGSCNAPEVCGGGGVAHACGVGLPPDPATIAPPLRRTTPTDFTASVEFLYSGDRPIQLGVEPETIESHRASLVRGRARAADGSALSGVAVDVLGHPELGNTLTRADGMFDLVVNGGGQLVLRFSKASLLPAQRQVQAPWRGVVWASPVVLIPEETLAGSAPALLPLGLQYEPDLQGARRQQVRPARRRPPQPGQRLSTVPCQRLDHPLPSASARRARAPGRHALPPSGEHSPSRALPQRGLDGSACG
jgi:hypothetical protein